MDGGPSSSAALHPTTPAARVAARQRGRSGGAAGAAGRGLAGRAASERYRGPNVTIGGSAAGSAGGRTRTARPTRMASSGVATIRPRSDTPSVIRTTTIGYGASAARRPGGTRITVNDATWPSPSRGAGSQVVASHAGHTALGGTASARHPRHRWTTRCPWRTPSKNALTVSEPEPPRALDAVAAGLAVGGGPARRTGRPARTPPPA